MYLRLVVSIILLSFFSVSVAKDVYQNDPYGYVEAFHNVYESGRWGGTSGAGSKPENAAQYLSILQKFFKDPQYNKIVDFGSGDWQLMSNIYIPNDKEYLGYDVSTVILEKTKHHSKENIKFHHTSGVRDFVQQGVKGDLIIVKDVLQHMQTEDIKIFIEEVLPNYKAALITNDYKPHPRKGINGDLKKLVGHRSLDLRQEPFNLQNTEVILKYKGPQDKMVLLYKNPN